MISSTPIGGFSAVAMHQTETQGGGVGNLQMAGGRAVYGGGYPLVYGQGGVSVVCRSTIGAADDIFKFDGATHSVENNYPHIAGGYWNDSDNVVHWDLGVLYSEGLPIYSGDISCACVASGGYLVASSIGNVQLITDSGTSKYSEWLPASPKNAFGLSMEIQAQAFVSKNVIATIYAVPYDSSQWLGSILAYTPTVLLTTVDVTNDGLTLTTIGTYPVVLPSDGVIDIDIMTMGVVYFVHQDSIDILLSYLETVGLAYYYRANMDISVTAAGLSAGKSVPPVIVSAFSQVLYANVTEALVYMIDTVLDISVYVIFDYSSSGETYTGYLSMGGTTITLPSATLSSVSTAYDDKYAYCAIDGTVYSTPLGGGDVTPTIMPQPANVLVCEVIR